MKLMSDYTLSHICDQIWAYIQSIKEKRYNYLMIIIDEFGRFCYYHTLSDFTQFRCRNRPILFYQIERRDVTKYTYEVFYKLFHERVNMFRDANIRVSKLNKPMLFNNDQSFLLFHNGFVAKVDIHYIMNETEMFTADDAHLKFLSLLSPDDMDFFLTNKPVGPLTQVKTKLYILGLWTPRESDHINLNTLMDLLNDSEYSNPLYNTIKNIQMGQFFVAENPTEFAPDSVVLEIYKKDNKVVDIKLNSY